MIVEGTAGNTGIGLALVANALGYKTVIVIPDTQSQEKKDLLRLQGAELIEVPAVAYSDPNNYVKLSGRLASRLAKEHPAGAIWANQFDNVANRQGHFETTGPGNLGANGRQDRRLHLPVGTGGTLAGVALALKAKNPAIKIAIADPLGAALYSYYTSGELKSSGSSITEGIGQGRITANLEDAPVDIAYQIPDEEALPILFDLAEHEGLLLGGSSGVNVAGAIRLAKELGPGHTIVTSSPILARAINRNCSTRHFCAQKICRSRAGWNASRRSNRTSFDGPGHVAKRPALMIQAAPNDRSAIIENDDADGGRPDHEAAAG